MIVFGQSSVLLCTIHVTGTLAKNMLLEIMGIKIIRNYIDYSIYA